MSQKSRDKVKEIRARVEEALRKLENERSEGRYLLVKEESLRALTNILKDAVDKLNPGTVKEALLDVEAGMQWMIKNAESIGPEEKRILQREPRKNTSARP